MDKDWGLYSNTYSSAIHSEYIEEFDKGGNFRRELTIIIENQSFYLRTPKYMEDSKNINYESMLIGRIIECKFITIHLWFHLTESFGWERIRGRGLSNNRA